MCFFVELKLSLYMSMQPKESKEVFCVSVVPTSSNPILNWANSSSISDIHSVGMIVANHVSKFNLIFRELCWFKVCNW